MFTACMGGGGGGVGEVVPISEGIRRKMYVFDLPVLIINLVSR